jgi:hypothetical protein
MPTISAKLTSPLSSLDRSPYCMLNLEEGAVVGFGQYYDPCDPACGTQYPDLRVWRNQDNELEQTIQKVTY